MLLQVFGPSEERMTFIFCCFLCAAGFEAFISELQMAPLSIIPWIRTQPYITKWQGAHPCRDQMERQESLLHHPPAFQCSNTFWSSKDFLFIFSEQIYK